jgi:hypothetical protein
MTIITGLDEITLVDTPVTYSTWTQEGRVDQVRHEPRASLFKTESRAAYRPATLITCNAFGDPFVKTGRLDSAFVRPRAGSGQSPWELHIGMIEQEKRKAIAFRRDFPADAVVLMWGFTFFMNSSTPPIGDCLRGRFLTSEAWQPFFKRGWFGLLG